VRLLLRYLCTCYVYYVVAKCVRIDHVKTSKKRMTSQSHRHYASLPLVKSVASQASIVYYWFQIRVTTVSVGLAICPVLYITDGAGQPMVSTEHLLQTSCFGRVNLHCVNLILRVMLQKVERFFLRIDDKLRSFLSPYIH